MAMKRKEFLVKSFNNMMVQFSSNLSLNSWPPFKVSSLFSLSLSLRETNWQKIQTVKNLKGRHKTLVNRCFLCKDQVESCNHTIPYGSNATL